MFFLSTHQIVDFLNVSDEPVLGYTPPTSVTTLHLHLWSCSLDYRWQFKAVQLIQVYDNSVSLSWRFKKNRPLICGNSTSSSMRNVLCSYLSPEYAMEIVSLKPYEPMQ